MLSGVLKGSPEVLQCMSMRDGGYNVTMRVNSATKGFRQPPASPYVHPFLSLVRAALILNFKKRFPLGSVLLLF